MSLKTYDVTLSDDTVFTLRLTAHTLSRYAAKHGEKDGSTFAAVLQSVENIDARTDLFSFALGHTKNENPTTNGAEFTDLLIDDGWSDTDFRVLVLHLAEGCGLIDHDKVDALISATMDGTEKTMAMVANLLRGNAAAADESEDREENPT